MRFMHMNKDLNWIDLGLHKWPGTKPHQPNSTDRLQARDVDSPYRLSVKARKAMLDAAVDTLNAPTKQIVLRDARNDIVATIPVGQPFPPTLGDAPTDLNRFVKGLDETGEASLNELAQDGRGPGVAIRIHTQAQGWSPWKRW